MIKVKYNIGSKPHIKEFKIESEFVKWIKENYKYKIFEISGAAEKGIMFRNIDLTGLTLIDELDKVDEETKEFKDAVHEYLYLKIDKWSEKAINESKEHIKEEFCDVIQSHLSILKILEIDIPEITEYWNKKHLEKIKSRPRAKEELNHD